MVELSLLLIELIDSIRYAYLYAYIAGDIIFDTIRCSKMELGKTSGRTTPVWIGLDYAESVPFSQLVRYTLSKDPSGSTGSSKWSVAKRDLSSTQLDFPSLNPRVVGKKVCFSVGYHHHS